MSCSYTAAAAARGGCDVLSVTFLKGPPKETHRALSHLQRSCCRKKEGTAAWAELLLTQENLLVHSSVGDVG